MSMIWQHPPLKILCNQMGLAGGAQAPWVQPTTAQSDLRREKTRALNGRTPGSVAVVVRLEPWLLVICTDNWVVHGSLTLWVAQWLVEQWSIKQRPLWGFSILQQMWEQLHEWGHNWPSFMYTLMLRPLSLRREKLCTRHEPRPWPRQ
jgi:hypothetical protein